jgi:hypothetical protein
VTFHDYEDGDWSPPENPLEAALRTHRYQPPATGIHIIGAEDTVCSCGATPDVRPDDDYEWWILHLKGNI